MAAIEISQIGPLLPCKIECEQSFGVTFSVVCQHRGVSFGLTCSNKENHFFFYFLTISPIFSISPFLEKTKWAFYLRKATYVKKNICEKISIFQSNQTKNIIMSEINCKSQGKKVIYEKNS